MVPRCKGRRVHRNPTPGPAEQRFVYGHLWVTVCCLVRHRWYQTIGLPLLGLIYVRQKHTAKIPRCSGWQFRTKLQLAAQGVLQLAGLAQALGKSVRVVVDGFYAKRQFLRPLQSAGVTVIGRLRKDAALRTLPEQRPGRRGRPRKYGTKRIDLRRRAAHPHGWKKEQCVVYGRREGKLVKSFLATWPPAGGMIRVVIVKEADGREYFFSTDPEMTAREILEDIADRAAIEQNFHHLKEVWGAGKQQLRNIWANIGAWNLLKVAQPTDPGRPAGARPLRQCRKNNGFTPFALVNKPLGAYVAGVLGVGQTGC